MIDNPELHPKTLDGPEPREWHPVQARQGWLDLLGNLPWLLVISAALWWVVARWEAGPLSHPGTLALANGVLAFRLLVYPLIAVRHRHYALRRLDIVLRSGWLWRSTVIVGHARIQHVEAGQGPLQRWAGLGWVKVFTAGGIGSDLVINGLKLDESERIADWISQRSKEAQADAHGELAALHTQAQPGQVQPQAEQASGPSGEKGATPEHGAPGAEPRQ